MPEKMKITENIREMDPPAPGAADYGSAVMSTASLPAVEPGQNDVGSYKTGAQPKSDLGGEAKFK